MVIVRWSVKPLDLNEDTFSFSLDQKFFMASVKSTYWKRYCLLIKAVAVILTFFCLPSFQLDFSFILLLLFSAVKFSFCSLSSSFFVAFIVTAKTRQSSVVKITELDITISKRETRV